ncbi:hypothetical protein Gohar_004904 [Gossypium harknessii]|uniref:Zinc knuckle CX2CX4HX4C domain-containing protein n=1 Tax=Gossypium harknessii TaxID=34285 RepID=A0A7J9H691_9ROSI|nr:hypothetical protein [Gossypium harknessii]
MLDGQEKEALGNVIKDSLLAPTSTEDVPRTLRKFKRTRTISYGQEDLVDACEEGMVDGGSSPQSQNASYRDHLVGLIHPNNRLGRIGMLKMLMVMFVLMMLFWTGGNNYFWCSCNLFGRAKMGDAQALAHCVDCKTLGENLGNQSSLFQSAATLAIVSCVGRVIRIDRNTEDVQRGGFARVCIDLDLTKPLCSFVSLGKGCRRVEYNGLQLIYFYCGKFGHRKDSCPMSTTADSDSDKVLSSLTHVASDMPSEMPLQLTKASFGPWMRV